MATGRIELPFVFYTNNLLTLYNSTTIKDETQDDGLYDKLLNISGFRKSKTRKNRKQSKKYTRKKN